MVGLILKLSLEEHVDACVEGFAVSFAVSVVDVVVDLESGLMAVEWYFFDVGVEGGVVLGVELEESYFLWFWQLKYDVS